MKSNDTIKDLDKKYYAIFWKYTIKPENRIVFEKEYGSVGTWSKIFSKSNKYIESVLHQNTDDDNSYILIDKWIDKESYEAFKKENQEVYDNQGKEFQHLYLTEEKIGTFYSK